MRTKSCAVIISGPSGVGKSSVLAKLLKIYPEKYIRSVSATTRNPRFNERDGEHYHFISKEKFKQGIEKNRFLEWAEYNSNFYGTPKDFLVEQINKGKFVLLDIEIQGVLQIKGTTNLPFLYLILVPPTFEELERRLISRNTDTSKAQQWRLKQAKHELTFQNKFDYIVINDKLEDAVHKINEIIQEYPNKT